MFLGTSQAREAALDGRFQTQEQSRFHLFVFIEELYSLLVVSCLTQELDCDEIIGREWLNVDKRGGNYVEAQHSAFFRVHSR